MTVGELKEALKDIDDDKIVLVVDDDLEVHYAIYAELDEYKRRYVDSNDIPFCISC